MEIVLLGDSLVAQYEDSKRPLAGWGEFLKSELIDVDENLHIDNLAVPGRSFYEFFYQDSQAIIDRLQKNDIVIISFGHNDALYRNHIDVKDFENLYHQFMGKLLKAKTKPVVVTPPLPLEIFSELDFEKFYQILDIEKKVARKENLPCIELDRYTRLLKYKYQDMSSLYLQLREGDSENYPEGIKDPVHFNIQGAKELSEFVAKMLKAQVLEGLNKTLEVFLEARRREGEALAVVLNGYCDRIEEAVNELAPKIPEIITSIQKKLEERLEDALSKTLVDRSTLTREEVSDRIRQEVILYAIKLDVDEEMKRLLTHVEEVRRLLNNGGEVGKRLDFMMQELNREANTLGSKAAAIEMTQTSLTLKVNIEKMREQVQNFE